MNKEKKYFFLVKIFSCIILFFVMCLLVMLGVRMITDSTDDILFTIIKYIGGGFLLIIAIDIALVIIKIIEIKYRD